MSRPSALVVIALFAFNGCMSSSPEQQFVAAMATALGGADRVRALSSVVMEGAGSTTNLGQDMTWEATGQAFTLSDVRRVLDLTGPRARTEQTRTPNFLYFQGPQPVRQIVGFDGDLAYAIAPNGNATRQGATAARERRNEFYHHPLTIAHAMLATPASVGNVRSEGEGRRADVAIGDVTFIVQMRGNGDLHSVSSPGYHPNLGDITVETTFEEYKVVDGFRVPTRLVTRSDKWKTSELAITTYTFGSVIDAAAPAAVASAPAPGPAAPNVVATPVAPGITLLAGQSHHSVLVEFADHMTLIEAPQSEARTLAVIAKARELMPAKPLTELVMSHHHFDHSAGLRAAVAEGLTVITHKANAQFVDEMIKRPHTMQPEALAKKPRPAKVTVVDDALTLKDEAMTLALYPIAGNPHGETMLMTYAPSARVLIQADAFSPGGTYHPYAANLLESIRQRELQVERIVPLHGTPITLADLASAVAAQPAAH